MGEPLPPFEDPVGMGFYWWGNGVILSSMYLALLSRLKEPTDNNHTRTSFAIALIVAHILMFPTILIGSALLATIRRQGSRVPRIRSEHVTVSRNNNLVQTRPSELEMEKAGMLWVGAYSLSV